MKGRDCLDVSDINISFNFFNYKNLIIWLFLKSELFISVKFGELIRNDKITWRVDLGFNYIFIVLILLSNYYNT